MSFHRIKPILFNTEMVRAILDGRKTVTRRVIKPRNAIRAKKEGYKQGGYGLWIDPSTDNGDKQGHIKDYSISDMWSTWKWYIEHYAPYQIGDILYVRETWCKGTDIWDCKRTSPEYFYKADYRDARDAFEKDIKWRPSIHMPKEAARIWLKVTDVRVERLQDITPKQAGQEGVEWETDNSGLFRKLEFKRIWNSTIKKQDMDSYGWDANPWVFVVSFEKIEKEKL